MASCRIEWKRSAEKELRQLDSQAIPRILAAVEELGREPVPQNSRKLHGAERTYRIRVGDWRVVYQYDPDTSLVTVFRVRHRREAYR